MLAAVFRAEAESGSLASQINKAEGNLTGILHWFDSSTEDRFQRIVNAFSYIVIGVIQHTFHCSLGQFWQQTALPPCRLKVPSLP